MNPSRGKQKLNSTRDRHWPTQSDDRPFSNASGNLTNSLTLLLKGRRAYPYASKPTPWLAWKFLVYCVKSLGQLGRWRNETTSFSESQQTVVDHMATTKGAITVRESLRSCLLPVIRDQNGMWTS